jgi:hypothetical protein
MRAGSFALTEATGPAVVFEARQASRISRSRKQKKSCFRAFS